MTEIVDVSEAQDRLEHLIEQAVAGQRVIITSSGVPVADLIPYGSRHDDPAEPDDAGRA